MTKTISNSDQLRLIHQQFQKDFETVFPTLSSPQQRELIKASIQLFTQDRNGNSVNIDEIKAVIDSALSDESQLTDDQKKDLVNFLQQKLQVQVVENLGKAGYTTMKISTFKALLLTGLAGMALIKKKTLAGYSTTPMALSLGAIVSIPLFKEEQSDRVIQPLLHYGKKTGQFIFEQKEKLGFVTIAILVAKKYLSQTA